jgi:quinol monooxygenase YgiN
MITIVARLKAAPGKEDALRAVLSQMVADVKANEPGCAAYQLHVSEADPAEFLFYEQYRDEESLAAHGKTDHMRSMGRALRDQQLTAGAPVIERFTFITGAA